MVQQMEAKLSDVGHCYSVDAYRLAIERKIKQTRGELDERFGPTGEANARAKSIWLL